MAEIHNPKVIGHLSHTNAPVLPEHGVRLQDLDARIAPLKAFASDIVPTTTGIVAQKVYAPTVPANKILTSAVADTGNVTIKVLAQGGLFSAPSVTVNGTAVANWTASSDNLFAGSVDLVLAASGDVTIETVGGQTTKVAVQLATEGPVVQAATLGAYPGQQTEAKNNDVIAITGIVANDAVSIAVSDLGAAKSGTVTTFGANNSGGQGFKTFTGTFVVSNRAGAQLRVTVTAKNALGTNGAAKASDNFVALNQAVPTIGAIAVNYPNGQAALKNGDVAQVSSTVTGADSVAYAFNAAGQTASIENANDYAISKNVTLIAGTYTVADNYTITATKASNGAVATRSGAVRIANSPATAVVSVQGNPARLRTDANGETYTLVVTPNQLLTEAPTVTLAAGTWVGNWVNNSNVYTRTFSVSDADPRGAAAVTGSVRNLANTDTDINGSFTIGGMLERTITFAAFSRTAPLGANVGDFTKTRARYAGGTSDLARRADTTDVSASFTIVNQAGMYDPNGGYLFISDAAYAGANTSGTLQLTFEETL